MSRQPAPHAGAARARRRHARRERGHSWSPTAVQTLTVKASAALSVRPTTPLSTHLPTIAASRALVLVPLPSPQLALLMPIHLLLPLPLHRAALQRHHSLLRGPRRPDHGRDCNGCGERWQLWRRERSASGRQFLPTDCALQQRTSNPTGWRARHRLLRQQSGCTPQQSESPARREDTGGCEAPGCCAQHRLCQ
jgi:hypothetical protein